MAVKRDKRSDFFFEMSAAAVSWEFALLALLVAGIDGALPLLASFGAAIAGGLVAVLVIERRVPVLSWPRRVPFKLDADRFLGFVFPLSLFVVRVPLLFWTDLRVAKSVHLQLATAELAVAFMLALSLSMFVWVGLRWMIPVAPHDGRPR